jgi:hypothetical protein
VAYIVIPVIQSQPGSHFAMPSTVSAQPRGYRWGKFQGWTTFVLGIVLWVPTLFGRYDGIHWLVTLLVSSVMVVMGLGLIQKQRVGLILLYANLPVFILGFFVLDPPPLETVFVVLWYFVPAALYYPRRFQEFFSSSRPLSAPAQSNQPPKSPARLPDLGKHLAAIGTPQKTILLYLTWEMDVLQVVSEGRYCTTCVQLMDGKLYCATFDFGDDVLLEIMKAAAPDTLDIVTEESSKDEARPRNIILPTPVNVGIGAILGSLQEGAHDLFIPLVIVEVINGKNSPAKSD